MERKKEGRVFSAAVLRAALCVCCALVMLLTAAPAGGERLTWEERLEQAREKYNGETVNVYVNGRGRVKKDMINVRFYRTSGRKNEVNFSIRESLQINDEAEMQAVLEVVAGHELFSEEVYGTISFIKAEWIAHNLAYEMANGTDRQKSLVELAAGDKLRNVIRRAKELDVSPLATTSEQELAVYELIEALYCHRESGEDSP